MIYIPSKRILRPQQPVEINNNNRLTYGCTYLSNILDKNPYDVIRKDFGVPTGVTSGIGKLGPCATIAPAVGNNIQLNSNTDNVVPLDKCTVVYIREKRDLTVRGSTSFGASTYFGGTVEYSDNNLYWEFGSNNTFIANTTTTAVEAYIFIAGPHKQRQVWKNGALFATDTDTLTRANVTSPLYIGSYGSFTSDNENVYLFGIFDNEWSDEQCHDWFLNPYQLFKDPSARIFISDALNNTSNIPQGTLTLIGNAPVFDDGYSISNIPQGTLTLTGNAPTTDDGYSAVNIPQGSLTLTGNAPQFNVSDNFTNVPQGSLTLTGNAPMAAILRNTTIALTSQNALAAYVNTTAAFSSQNSIAAYKTTTCALTSQNTLSAYNNWTATLTGQNALAAYEAKNFKLDSQNAIAVYANAIYGLTAQNSISAYAAQTVNLTGQNSIAARSAYTVALTSQNTLTGQYAETTVTLTSQYALAAYEAEQFELSGQNAIQVYANTDFAFNSENTIAAFQEWAVTLPSQNSLSAYAPSTFALTGENAIAAYLAQQFKLDAQNSISIYTDFTTVLDSQFALSAYANYQFAATSQNTIFIYEPTQVSYTAQWAIEAAERFYAYAVNLTTGAAIKWENYDFFNLSGNTGCGSDGLYDLFGDTDGGLPIDAFVESGYLDLGSSARKRITDFYINKDGGKLKLEIDAENTGLLPYTLREIGQTQNVKADTAKGATGRRWKIKISNIKGSKAVVSDIEAETENLPRRV